MRPATAFLYLGLAALAVVLDQVTKQYVEDHMALGAQIDLLPFFALYHTRNTGIAFSMLSEFGVTGLVVLTLGVIGFVSWLAVKTDRSQTVARIGFALIIGGAIGNLIDRVTLGYVIDMFLFHTPVWSFAIFNVADVFITVGAVLVVIQEFLTWRGSRKPAGRPPGS